MLYVDFWGVGFRLANCKIYCLNYRFESEPITQACSPSICSAIRLVKTKKIENHFHFLCFIYLINAKNRAEVAWDSCFLKENLFVQGPIISKKIHEPPRPFRFFSSIQMER